MTYEEAKAVLESPDTTPEAKSIAKEIIEGAESKKSLPLDTDMDVKKAYAILESDDTTEDSKQMARQVLAQNTYDDPGNKPWVENYKSPEVGNRKFDWHTAYRREKNIDPFTKPDSKEIQDFQNWVQSKKNDLSIGKKANLQRVAADMHFKHSSEPWTDFIKSDRFQQFKNMLSDVEDMQQEETVDRIFSGEEPSPNGGKFAGWLTSFMLPVAKEYAKKNYRTIDGVGDIAAPLAFDVASNVAMLNPASGAIKAKMANGLAKRVISGVAGNVAAPVITETGNAIINEKPIDKAAIGALEGTMINIATPKLVEGLAKSTGDRFLSSNLEKDGVKLLHDNIDIANNTLRKVKEGVPFYNGDKLQKLTKKKGEGFVLEDVDIAKSRPDKAITAEYSQQLMDYAPLMRGKDKAISALPKTTSNVSIPSSFQRFAKVDADAINTNEMKTLLNKADESLRNKGDLSALTSKELSEYNNMLKEGRLHYIYRYLANQAEAAPHVKDYVINAMGRPQFGQRAGARAINYLFPGVNLFKPTNSPEERYRELYGLDEE